MARHAKGDAVLEAAIIWCELRITRVFSCVARRLKARASFMFAGGCRWRSLAVDGSSGASRGHAPVVRRPGFRWGGAVERPSAFQAGHIPSWRESCECLPADESVTPWSSSPYSRPVSGNPAAPGPVPGPSPNPIAAEPDGRRVLSRGGAADHAVTPQAPLTGSGCRGYSYGGFGEDTHTSTRMLPTF